MNVPIVNQPPTLNAINNLTINENAGLQTVSLSGITPVRPMKIRHLPSLRLPATRV